MRHCRCGMASLQAILDEIGTNYREIIDAAREMVVIHAVDGRVLLANRATQEVVGLPEADLLRMNIKDFISEAEHDAVRERAASRIAQVSRRMYSYEITIRSVSGSREPVEVNSSPIFADGQPVAMVAVARLKGASRRERDLEDERRAAVLANRAKSEFLARMSHEIRTPISIIFGLTDMALDEAMPSATRAHLEKAKAAAETLLSLVDDVLEFSRVEARKYALRPRPFALPERVASTLGTVATLAERRGLSLAMEVAPDVPDSLVGDPDRLHQILMNLLTNAIKFTDRGGIQVRVRRASTPAFEGVLLLFSVADTGIGIPIEHRAAIFDACKQVGGGRENGGGTGLGLAIARELVALHGGQIWVESEPGRGSVFHFTARFGESAAVAEIA